MARSIAPATRTRRYACGLAAASLTGILAVFLSFQAKAGPQDRPKVKVGDSAPTATLVSHNGTQAALGTVWAQQPTILVFYRGDW